MKIIVIFLLAIATCETVQAAEPACSFDSWVDLYAMRKRTELLKIKSARRLADLKNKSLAKKPPIQAPKIKKKTVRFKEKPEVREYTLTPS